MSKRLHHVTITIRKRNISHKALSLIYGKETVEVGCDNEVLRWDQSHLRSVIIYTKSSNSCSMHVRGL